MMSIPTDHLSRDKLSGPALRAFFKLAARWDLSALQQRALLGSPPDASYEAWVLGAYEHIDDDVLIRISYLLGIYKALHILLPEPFQADSWIKRPNMAPMFAGNTALEFLCRGGLSELRDVRSYLDGQHASI
ncbi:hypothetical protein [Stenotrophomonas cyclobalanopsidis]|uniref:hypothetical protein n=1 Tax=Stenotrophomonas cyclobalanopsidis TaxID=2771362 RepID=UPI0028AF7580|nr:hypothetical protein [Stenotrophomonas cyclobalanopsidis]